MSALHADNSPLERGYLEFRSLCRGETRWHVSCDHDYGLWHFAIHALGHRFEAIGPFTLKHRAQ